MKWIQKQDWHFDTFCKGCLTLYLLQVTWSCQPVRHGKFSHLSLHNCNCYTISWPIIFRHSADNWLLNFLFFKLLDFVFKTAENGILYIPFPSQNRLMILCFANVMVVMVVRSIDHNSCQLMVRSFFHSWPWRYEDVFFLFVLLS